MSLFFGYLRCILLVAIVTVLPACGGGSSSDSGDGLSQPPDKEYRWKMVTSWPPNLPINHDVVVKFAKDVEVMSRGRIKIKVYAGGELIPPLQAFDAVSEGSVQLAHSAAYYWAGKVPAAQFMTTVPFGMTMRGMTAWLYGGDGLKIWRELYAPFNVVPFPMGNTGVQMGGWFKKKIESVEDLQGLKMRIPGLGGKVLAKAGGNPVLLSASEIYTALERGTIDATEWVGPLHDVRFGLDRAARYYYYPGWHEPGTQLELIINKTVWDELPEDLQLIIESAAASANLQHYGQSEVENAKAYQKLKKATHVELLRFPHPVLVDLHAKTKLALAEEADKDPAFKDVYAKYESFRELIDDWGEITEQAYNDYFEAIKR